MFFLYMLRCSDGSYYLGHTDELEKRIAEHTAGTFEGYTSTRLPVELVYSEGFGTRLEALISERKLKGWPRAKKEALIRGDWKEISRLAKSSAAKAASIQQAQGDPSTGSGRTQK